MWQILAQESHVDSSGTVSSSLHAWDLHRRVEGERSWGRVSGRGSGFRVRGFRGLGLGFLGFSKQLQGYLGVMQGP